LLTFDYRNSLLNVDWIIFLELIALITSHQGKLFPVLNFCDCVIRLRSEF